MKENYAPQDNHKYYDQESKKPTIISSQAGMPISTEELGQRKEEAIKENGMKGMQSKEARHFENSKQEKKEQEQEQEQVQEQVQIQVKDISKTDQATNEQVSSQQYKSNLYKAEINEIKERSKSNSQQHKEDLEKEAFTKYRNAQDKDLPTAEEIIKQLRGENSNSDHPEILEVTDKQECMMENELHRPKPEKQQPIVQHANTEGLKEELIKCELAASSEEARIEQVKPEPSGEERVTTEQATEKQVGAENVERMIEEDRNEAKQAVTELIMESQANTKPEESKDIEIIDVKNKTPETEVPKSQEGKDEKELKVKVTDNLICEEQIKTQQIPKEDATNVNNVENVSKFERQQPATCELDKVEQTKTELAKTNVELAKIKEEKKGEQKVQKDEDELIEQENESAHTLAKEPQVTSADLADRGANDLEHIREKYGNSQGTATNTISTTDNVNEQSTVPDTKDEVTENKVDTNQDKQTNSDVISDTRDDNEKSKNSYDDPTGSQYVYSESSKDFKLSVVSNVPAHEDSKKVSENVSTKEDAPIEKVENSGGAQPRDDTKQLLINNCTMSQSNLPDHATKETVLKNDACKLNDVPVEKVEKYDISQQKDVTKQVPIERKTKSTDQKTGSSKETSLKGLTHKEKAQTKQEILTSKIKAHAEKEISAIKEGFANKDGLKNPTKPSSIGQNMTIRQKPPSQEVYKKQERTMNDGTVSAAVTATSQPAEIPQKQMKNNEHAKEKEATVTNTELRTSTMSFKMRENHTVQKDKKFGSPTDDKKMKSQHEDKLVKQDHLRKGDNVNIENTAPSIQLENEISAQDNSLSIMGIMVTVRERNPSEREENKEQDVLSVRCHNTDKHGPHVETNILSEKLSVNEQDYTETKHFMKETDSVTHKNFTDSTTEKTSQQKSSSPNDRPQRETLLPDHLAEKVVPPTVTVPAKNKVLAETQPPANKQDIIAEETKVNANRPPNAVLEITGIKGQEEIVGIRAKPEAPQVLPTTEMKRVISVSTTSNDNTEDVLHIDSIAIRVVPAVTEDVNKATQRNASNSSVIEKETQSNTQTTNDDVQKVLSSVRKQAQLLKNQPNLNNTTSQSSENEKTTNDTNEDETKNPPMEEGYFQVDKRDTGPHNNSTNVGQSSEAVAQEREPPRSLPNQPSSASRQDQNIKTSKQLDNSPNDKSDKDEKPGAGQSHHIRRHPMAKGRQRGFATLPDSTDSKVEVKPKPKVPIPEISALADYARLKVIVSKDDEDTLQEQPPNKKEGFFPLIQSRHSRRPVFTMDSQEDLVKEKSSQNQPSTQVKVSKEPTPVVFPITDKQHQRTGMFKLEAKENAEVQKSPMDQTSKDKANNGVKKTEDKIKDMLEKSRAKQAEEEKRAAQREEEQRALEREAIVAQIRERRKKQREAERHAEEHDKGKWEAEKRSLLGQNVMSAVNNDEQQKLSERELLIEANPDGQDRTLQQKTASDAQEQQRRAALEEQQKKVAQVEEQRRKAAKEEQLKKAALEEQTRRANEEQQRKAEEQKKAILEEKQKNAVQMEEQKRRLLLEEQQKRAAQKEQQRKIAEEEQQRQAAIIEEQKKKAAFEEQQKKLAEEEQQRKAAIFEEQQRRAAQKEQQSKMVEEEQQRKAAIIEEQKKKAAIEEQRKLAYEEQQKQSALDEQKQKSALEEQQRRAAESEQLRKMAEEEQQRKATIIEEQKKKATIEEQRKLAYEEQQKQVALEEQKQKAALEEQQRKKAEEEQQRKAALIEEQKKRAAIEDQQRKLAQEAQQRKAALEEQKQKAALEEQQRRAAEHEQLRKMAEKEQEKKAAIIEEKKKKAAIEEQERKLAYEEQQKQAALEEQKQKAAFIEAQKKRAAIEDQQRKLAQEAQQRKAAMEKQKQKAALEEQQRRAALEEQQRKKAEEEQHRKAAIIEEQKKRAAIEEQRKLAQEAQQRKAALEEQKQKAALEEQQRKKAEEEQHRKAAIIEEQKKRAAIEEQRKLAQEAQQRKAAMEQQKQKAALEEQQKRAAQKEQQRKMAEEEQRKAAIIEEEKKKRAVIEEQQRKAAAEEQQRKESLIEEQRRHAVLKEEQRRDALDEQLRKNKIVEEEQRRKEAIEEQRKIAQMEEMRRQAVYKEQLRMSAEIEKQKRISALEEEQQRKAKLEEQKQKVAMEEERKFSQIEEKRRQAAQEQQLRKAAETEEQKRREVLEEQKRNVAIEEQKKLAQIEEMRRQAAHEEQRRKIAEEEQQRTAAIIGEERREALEQQQRREAHEEQLRKAAIEEQRRKEALIEKQKRAREEEEEKRLAYIREERIRRQIEEEREAELQEEMTRHHQSSAQNQTHKGKDTRPFRGQDLPRNQKDSSTRKAVNQEETAQMEEQKNISDKEALQYYSLTSAEAEKPSSPQKRSNANGPDMVDDISRPHAPASPAHSQPRSTTASPAFGTKPSMFKVKDNTLRGSSLTKSIKPRFHKNFGDEFRVGSPMERVWEKNEGDLDTLRCRTPSTPLPQYRPFSRRSLALDDEDSRSIISNMSEDMESFATNATDLADIRALYDSDRPESACSFSSDVSRSFGKPPAVPPKSEKALRRAKRLATRRFKKELSKDVTEDSYEASMSEVANSDVVASPHFTPPISIARAPPAGSSVSLSHSEPSHQRALHTPHATGPISLPNSPPHTSTPVSVPSLQNPGSFSTSAAPRSIPKVPSSPTHHHAPKPVTQYQVESGFSQSYTQRRVMQDIGSGQYYVVDVPVEVKTKTFFDPETGKYVQLNVRESSRNAPQRQPLHGYPQPHLKAKLHANLQPNTSSNAQYQSYSSNSKGNQSAATSSGQSMTPATVIQDQQTIRSSMAHRQGGSETSYSPDKTPYMDTVNKADKAHHVDYNTQGSQGAITEGDRQLVNSRYGSRDIITMSELEDFMEVSDW
ncbi:trichohyalin [Boleophthalmus pectinirostris]|uniref:trichohyalin n=1 Tax=Boleophthalmus pectinirostris TaxID=150288 RepID=UPI002430D85B|nr:trichohyalin [Boleophthalmus pectinirostris]